MMRAQETHGDPGHDGQLRPGERRAQPVGGRLDPGRLEQGGGELVANQQGTHHERAHQHTVVEHDLEQEQGAIRRRIARRRCVCHMVTLLFLAPVSSHLH